MSESKNQNDSVSNGVADVIRRSLKKSMGSIEICPELSLIDDLDLDSPTVVDIMLDLEDHFKVKLSDAEMQSASTVHDVETLILRKKGQQ